MKNIFKNKVVKVSGIVWKSGKEAKIQYVNCTITNDEEGKTLSINDGYTQITIPFEPIEKYLK